MMLKSKQKALSGRLLKNNVTVTQGSSLTE